MKLNDLILLIKQADRAYYLDGMPIMTDAEYEVLKEQLRKQDPNNPLLKKVGDEDEKVENKVQLPNIMGSLNKIRPDNEALTKLYQDTEVLCMAKLDGLSMQLEYDEQGKFVAMYSRGNGSIGQDVTGRAKYMNFPKSIIPLKRKQYFFGEVVITKENFKKVKGNYKHPRNFVGGTLRPILTDEEFEKVSDDVKYNLSLIDFVCWDSNSATDSLMNAIENAKYQGFKTVDYDIFPCTVLNEAIQIEKINHYQQDYEYLTDGIVVKVNDKKRYEQLGKEANGLNPKGGRAIKLEVEDQASELGKVKDIEWTMSKRGLFIPVIILEEPINFDGAEIQRINACNLAYIKDMNIAIGNTVRVIRSGGVIPRAIACYGDSINFNLPKNDTCPHCRLPLSFNETHMYCSNIDCPGKKKAEIVGFFSTLNLEEVGGDTISFLYDNGFNTYEKLLTIKYEDLIKLEGFQASKSLKVERALNNALKDITLEKLMDVSQIFSNERTGLGETKASWIIDAYGHSTILASLNGDKDINGNFQKLDPKILHTIKGFGEASISLFTKNYMAFKTFYRQLKPYIKLKDHISINGPLSGMIFAFTQFRDQALEDLIIKNGGQVKGVSKKCKVLFAAGDSTKCRTAEKYGIPIIPSHQSREYVEDLLK